MIELPENVTLAKQINAALVGKTISSVTVAASPHKFAFYNESPAEFQNRLEGQTIVGAISGLEHTFDNNTNIICGDTLLALSTPIRYHEPGAKLPKSHQLLLSFTDGSHLSFTVLMWGAMNIYPADETNTKPKQNAKPSPLSDAFDSAYFDSLLSSVPQNLSAKAFLATEQRIPGLGNGVLQDILFNARIHPKRKLQDIHQFDDLFHSVKSTLMSMATEGGRDTEKDLFGNPGGYKTILSAKTLANPCPVCGDTIIRTAYLGGNIYFCPSCQPI